MTQYCYPRKGDAGWPRQDFGSRGSGKEEMLVAAPAVCCRLGVGLTGLRARELDSGPEGRGQTARQMRGRCACASLICSGRPLSMSSRNLIERAVG